MMIRIIRSELLKMRHTFSMKLVMTAPLATVLLGYFLSSGSNFTQFSVYNWWYFMILPLVVSIWSANMIIREKKTGMQNIVCLFVRLDKIWLGKTTALAILLFTTNLLLWLCATAIGFVTDMAVSPLDGLIGCVLLFLTYLWQISFIMLIASYIGYISTVLVSLAANIILPIAAAEKSWFLLIPYAIPARIVCPFFRMYVNGVPLESGSPLLTTKYVFPALIISLLFAVVVFWGSSKLFSRGGQAYG